MEVDESGISNVSVVEIEIGNFNGITITRS